MRLNLKLDRYTRYIEDILAAVFVLMLLINGIGIGITNATIGATLSIGKDYAVVSEDRIVSLNNGMNRIILDFYREVLPGTITVSSSDCLELLSQNYDPGIDAGLYALEDKIVTVATDSGDSYTGKLALVSAKLVAIESLENTYIIPMESISLIKYSDSSLPELELVITADCPGTNKINIVYMTEGFAWDMDYTAIFENNRLNFYGLARITNNAGTYKDAKVTLVAGDVRRAREVYYHLDSGRVMLETVSKTGYTETERTEAFEYHTYHVPVPINLTYGETSTVLLISADVPAEKVFTYTVPYWTQESEAPVDVSIEFENSETSGGGVLPEGTFRVFTDNGFGGYMLAGEDVIDNTPPNETVTLKIGNAFDVIGKTVRTNHAEYARSQIDTYNIMLKNKKNVSVSVKVIGSLPRWSNWEITSSDIDYVKESAVRVVWNVDVPANDETTFTYTIRRWW